MYIHILCVDYNYNIIFLQLSQYNIFFLKK